MTNEELKAKADSAIASCCNANEFEQADSFALEALALDVHRIANVLDELQALLRSVAPLATLGAAMKQQGFPGFAEPPDGVVDLEIKHVADEPVPPSWVEDVVKND